MTFYVVFFLNINNGKIEVFRTIENEVHDLMCKWSEAQDFYSTGKEKRGQKALEMSRMIVKLLGKHSHSGVAWDPGGMTSWRKACKTIPRICLSMVHIGEFKCQSR